MQQLRIRAEDGQIVPMVFSESQRHIWRYVAPDLDANSQLWYIVLKGRQVYATTFFENLLFTRTLEEPNTNSLVIAQDLDTSGDVFNMVKRFYDRLAIPKTRPSKVKELLIPIKGGVSKFRVVSAGIAAKGRGTTQTCLHCSEVAFWPHQEVMTGLVQAVPNLPNTVWVVESTANGMEGQGKLFYQMWKEAVSGKSKLKPIFIPWFIMDKYRELPALEEGDLDDEERILLTNFSKYGLDTRSLRWRRNIINTKLHGNVEMFHQEYPCTPSEAFISTGLPAFNSVSLLKQQANIKPAPARGVINNGKFALDPRGEIFLWALPQDGRDYVIGVDTSEGFKGGDYACAQIIRMDNMEQVGVAHGLIQPYELSRIVNELGRWYKNAVVCVEVNNTGNAVQDFLMRKWMYPRLHLYRGKPTKYDTENRRIFGWSTNTHTRPLLIEAGRLAIDSGLVIIHDEATVEEARHFSRQDNGKYQATGGHDDRILALLLALRSRMENYAGAARMLEVPMSDPDLRGVRVIDMSKMRPMRDIHSTLLKQQAKNAVRTFMQF